MWFTIIYLTAGIEIWFDPNYHIALSANVIELILTIENEINEISISYLLVAVETNISKNDWNESITMDNYDLK